MDIHQQTITTLRLLAADMIQKANSGHPGLPLGASPMAYTLFTQIMNHDPKNSDWINRDRFVLSAGHGSSMLYGLLHLCGYDISIEDLKQFRQWGSKTPGHPEFGHTDGVEITTGPLGQGIASATGMALAEKYLAARFNKPGFPVVDHFTYVLCGDGCLMEGISAESSSLAGTLGLSKLIVLYDSNNMTIEGSTDIAFTEDVKARYEAYGWHVEYVSDGNDISAIKSAIERAKADPRPSLIEIKTKIGATSPAKEGKASAHGEPLGADEIKIMKTAAGFDSETHFHVPEAVKAHMIDVAKKGGQINTQWQEMMKSYQNQYPDDYNEFIRWFDGVKPELDETFWQYEGNLATRSSSEKVLNRLMNLVPNIIGGAADLAPSTKSIMTGRGDFSKDNPTGANLHFGIREHAMAAMANGIAAHGGLVPYVAGFFVFSDYMKPSMRLSALMNLPVIYIMTHDSIGVGEDGPTHQPIEQLAALRSIPNFTVIRPCDTHETAAAWAAAISRKSPTAIVLSRQNLTLFDNTGKEAMKGAYILKDSKNEPDLILMASGSEVELIFEAAKVLEQQGVGVRVVSMPSWELFEEQSAIYKQEVLPRNVTKRLAVEAAATIGWHKYTGLDGAVMGIDHFGASAPADRVFNEFGFTVSNVVEAARKVLRITTDSGAHEGSPIRISHIPS